MTPPAPSKSASSAMDAKALARTLRRMADEIVELNEGTDDLVIVGIQRRGVQIAERLVKLIADREKVSVPQGDLDITIYRDDLQTVGPRHVIGNTTIPVEVDGNVIASVIAQTSRRMGVGAD